MSRHKFSKTLAKDILEGKNKYIENGYLSVKQIRFVIKDDEIVLELLSSDGTLLGCLYAHSGFKITCEQNMKITVED